jgi:hypothetical protein
MSLRCVGNNIPDTYCLKQENQKKKTISTFALPNLPTRVTNEKLLAKKFLAFCGIRSFSTRFKTARHSTLS